MISAISTEQWKKLLSLARHSGEAAIATGKKGEMEPTESVVQAGCHGRPLLALLWATGLP